MAMSEKKEIILCLDVGTKRIGVAKSDALGIAAHLLPVILRKTDEQAAREIADLVKAENVDRIVVGLPRNMDDTLGPAVEMVQSFTDQLKKQISVPVEYWDERLSTREAERFLIEEADMSRGKRKSKIDSMAAQIILASYMQAKRRQ